MDQAIKSPTGPCEACRQSGQAVLSGTWPPPDPLADFGGGDMYRCKRCGMLWPLSPTLPSNPSARDFVRYIWQLFTTGHVARYLYLLVFLINLLAYVITTYTNELLLLPLYEAALLAFVSVVPLSYLLYLLKKKSKPIFGIFKTLFGLSLAIWTIIDTRHGHEDIKGIAIWISLILTVDFVADGLENIFRERKLSA